MSRHLAFWKYEDGVYLDHQKVYEEVRCNQKKMDGLSASGVILWAINGIS